MSVPSGYVCTLHLARKVQQKYTSFIIKKSFIIMTTVIRLQLFFFFVMYLNKTCIFKKNRLTAFRQEPAALNTNNLNGYKLYVLQCSVIFNELVSLLLIYDLNPHWTLVMHNSTINTAAANILSWNQPI